MQVKLKNVRQSFASIRKPYTPKTGDPKWTFNGICGDDSTVEFTNDKGKKVSIPHTDFDKVIEKVCKDKWGKSYPNLQLFVYNRADKEVGVRGAKVNEDGDFYDGYEADTMFFSASTKVADAPEGILIVDQKREPLPASKGHPVNGDYVNAVINVFAFEYEGKKGVSASLEGIQYLSKGVPFGFGKIDKDAFDEEQLDDDDLDEDDIF